VVRADSFESFRRCFAEWPGPSLNVAYADAAGHIGWQLIGHVPRRKSGFGTLPQPGWDDATGWNDEPVPFDEMPCVFDPAEGFVATANNQPLPSGSEPFLGVDWIDGYRQSRIVEALAGGASWDVATCQRLQVDVASVPWRELRPLVLEAARSPLIRPQPPSTSCWSPASPRASPPRRRRRRGAGRWAPASGRPCPARFC
jgi:penicillin amidase